MDLEEFEKLNSGLKVLLFKGEDEVEEDSKKETDLLVGNNLYKLYGNNKEESAALKGVTLRVHEGDFICIMGPSGSGKSTLINLLSTIDEPTRGTIKFNGKNILSMGEREIAKFRYENLGFIFQNFNLIDNLTIKENISIPMLLASNSMEEIEYKVNRIVEKLDIRDLLNKYPYECSGGENQRVACARALVTSPKIIVADEPTGNLDTKNSHELLTMLQRLNREGTTILMVTHDNMIASYSQKLLFIRDGRVDKILKREDLSQKEYFHKIIDITSKESQNLIDIL
ncbi:ABC transporter ATP-binding protein [Clostridium sp. Sa3CVN1]|uniref:ABC transporter ATP-binding protein n=2 Tax=Clostridium TaxID=1485 RepID=A0ABR8PWR5_9CLOT|nr:ABC transporter ATP-binding protein [Clostridium cibarium]